MQNMFAILGVGIDTKKQSETKVGKIDIFITRLILHRSHKHIMSLVQTYIPGALLQIGRYIDKILHTYTFACVGIFCESKTGFFMPIQMLTLPFQALLLRMKLH